MGLDYMVEGGILYHGKNLECIENACGVEITFLKGFGVGEGSELHLGRGGGGGGDGTGLEKGILCCRNNLGCI